MRGERAGAGARGAKHARARARARGKRGRASTPIGGPSRARGRGLTPLAEQHRSGVRAMWTAQIGRGRRAGQGCARGRPWGGSERARPTQAPPPPPKRQTHANGKPPRTRAPCSGGGGHPRPSPLHPLPDPVPHMARCGAGGAVRAARQGAARGEREGQLPPINLHFSPGKEDATAPEGQRSPAPALPPPPPSTHPQLGGGGHHPLPSQTKNTHRDPPRPSPIRPGLANVDGPPGAPVAGSRPRNRGGGGVAKGASSPENMAKGEACMGGGN